MLYPLKFIPVYKNIIWGGRNLEKHFKRQLPEGNIAESWEICCREDGMSIVENGEHQNQKLSFLIDLYKDKLLGTSAYEPFHNSFPLLIKLIDANDKLSVQVHPGDEYAVKNNDGSGKTEMWYIIAAKPDAKLIYGIKSGIKREDFITAVSQGNVEMLLNEVAVKPGDIFYIPAGMVHAILDGILIAEIQQNSNTTYRLYDWNRVDSKGNGRELHINKALDVINFTDIYGNNEEAELKFDTYSIRVLTRNNHFTIEEININNEYRHTTDGSRFYIYMSISGSGIINYDKGQVEINPGDTIFIPANMGLYEIAGTLKLLKIYL